SDAHQDLTTTSEGRDTSRFVDAAATVVIDAARRFRLVRADAHPNRRPSIGSALDHRRLDRERAVECGFGRREGDEEPVAPASLLDLLAIELIEQPAQGRVVPAQNLGPP